MLYAEAAARLTRTIASPLPGSRAHAELAPRPPRQWPEGFNPARIRHAAGLLLVTAIDRHAHVVLTVRAGTLERHGGQVSLPGGVVDPGETFEQAALREAHEEIGLETAALQVLGPLTPVDIPVSGFRLHPVLALAPDRPDLRASDGEVARILEVPIARLAAPEARGERPLSRQGATIAIPFFFIDGAEIWGATGMILAEFLALLAEPLACGDRGFMRNRH